MDTTKESPPVGYKSPRITPEWDYDKLVSEYLCCARGCSKSFSALAEFLTDDRSIIMYVMYRTRRTANPPKIVEAIQRHRDSYKAR